jgi:arylsulfatase A-like enzyme
MSAAKNVLFIMYDQLRFDYLSCAGHPYLKTPNFDRLATKGVRFTNAYVQSPICGPSRMSCYTGRYVHSHGAAGNGYPLKIGERTLGDYLRDAGAECWLIGKTHMVADVEGMRRLGVPADSVIGARVSECGYDIWVREDGLVCIGPENPDEPIDSPYNDALIAKGYPAPNPWHVHGGGGAALPDTVRLQRDLQWTPEIGRPARPVFRLHVAAFSE